MEDPSVWLFCFAVFFCCQAAAAFAEFYDVAVTNIKITVELPENQSKVGLSEIKILGKA